MVSAMGLVRVVPNSEMVRQEQEDARRAAEERNNEPDLQGLAKHVMACWEDARTAKQAILPRMLKAQNARLGRYDADKLAAIKSLGGSEEYARITANKCRVVEAWLKDIFIGQTEKPWTLAPTPKPDFPPEVEMAVKSQIAAEIAIVYAQTGRMPDPTIVRGQIAQQLEAEEERLRDEARKATQRMERLMEDQLIEGGFITALTEFIIDLCAYPSAVMKGPVLRRKKVLTWKNEDGGSMAPQVIDAIVPEFERVDPFRAYPAAGACGPNDGYFIEHLTFGQEELYDLIGTPGYSDEAIRAVIAEANGGYLNDWLGFVQDGQDEQKDQPARQLKRKVFNIDCLAFHGPVRGQDLLDWGVESIEVDDPAASYEACVWLIGRWVIKAQMNYNPLGQRPYYKASFEEVPGEFWGQALPDLLDDVQGVVNAAVRALVNNMGFASGPQVEVNVDRLDPEEDPDEFYPWKRWKTTTNQFGGQTPALNFFQPQSNAQELLTVIENFYRMGDDFSMMPRYMAGSDKVAGAGRTASGLSMLMDSAHKGLKGIVGNVDLVLKMLLETLYNHNMMYADDATVKGDAQVVARGAVSLMQREALQLRRNEFLNVTANPIDSQIMGLEGRSEVLREVAKGLEMDTNRIVPPREKLMQAAAMAQPMPAPQGAAVGAGDQLQNGGAVTDTFSPNAMTPQ